MKIIADNTSETIGTSTAVESGRMGVDPDNIAHVMAMLSKQYSDGPLAVLREYVTNGIDSHVMAGAGVPVEVHLPSVFRPTLVVTDHGLGLSRDEIVSIYANYGATTKSDDNSQVGGFGIGAKAAFAVGSQFTVIGRKDGWRTTVLFKLSADNEPTWDIVAHDQVENLANGVTVRIPVTDPTPYAEAAKTLFAHFSPADVSCPGIKVGSHIAGSIDFGDGVHASRTYGHGNDHGVFVVMGGVAYPVSEHILGMTLLTSDFSLPRRASIVVPIGAVDLTPSRESLRDSGRTVAGVRAALARWHAAVISTTNERIRVASTFTEALFARLTGIDILGQNTLDIDTKWDGLALDGPKLVLPNAYRSYGTTFRVGSYLNVDTSLDPSKVRVLVGEKAMSAETVRRRMKLYAAANPGIDTLVVAGDRDGASGLTWGEGTPLATVTFEQFKEETATESAPGVPRGTFAYTVIDYALGDATKKMTVADLRAEGDRVVVLPIGLYQGLRRTLLVGSGMLAVVLTGTQQVHSAHERLPQAQRASMVDRYAIDFIESVTPEQWAVVESSMFYNRAQHSAKLMFRLSNAAADNVVDVIDPRFAALGPVMDGLAVEGRTETSTRTIISMIEMTRYVRPNRFADLAAEYPLLAFVASSSYLKDMAPVAEYVNLVAAERGRQAVQPDAS